jgi:hypothetical protein
VTERERMAASNPNALQLERRLAPQTGAEHSRSLSLAMVLRERRRRRCEASGEPSEELSAPDLRPAWPTSIVCGDVATSQMGCANGTLGQCPIFVHNAYHPRLLRVGISTHRPSDEWEVIFR